MAPIFTLNNIQYVNYEYAFAYILLNTDIDF